MVGTVDTKGEELRYLRDLLVALAVPTVLVDVSTLQGKGEADVSAAEVAAFHPGGAAAVFQSDRGEAVEAMATAFRAFLESRRDFAGGIGLGGSGGAAIIAPAFSSIPIGVPKMLVSTMAASDVTAYVDASDLQMINPVTDLTGLNRVTRLVLGNAAHALAGMIRHRSDVLAEGRPALGLTVYGVTTPCVNALSERLRGRYDCLAFHAIPAGGRSLGRLMRSGHLAGLLDVTTSDVPDLLFGGAFPAPEDRFRVVAESGTPYVGSCGALDMINFREPSTVPERFRKRTLLPHNPHVTLVRTNPEENRTVGAWIARQLNACRGPVRFLLPEKGVSKVDAPGQPFHDPEADEALFGAIEESFEATADRRVLRLPLHLNDPAFADALAAQFLEITGGSQ